MELPSLIQLKCFLEVAERGSFTEAAQALEIDQSTISRHIKRFEKSIGETLFVRDSLPVRLTPHGIRVMEELRDPAYRLLNVLQRVCRLDNTETLICHTNLIALFYGLIAPHLPEFSKLNGFAIDLKMQTESRWAWPRDHSAVILTNERPERMPRDIAEAPLYDEELICVGAASLIEKLGSGSTFPDVEAAYSCSMINANALADMVSMWCEAVGLEPRRIRFGAAYQEWSSAVRAATAGDGLLVAPVMHVQPDLEKGLLRLFNPSQVRTGHQYLLFSSRNGIDDQRIDVFCDWLHNIFYSAGLSVKHLAQKTIE